MKPQTSSTRWTLGRRLAIALVLALFGSAAVAAAHSRHEIVLGKRKTVYTCPMKAHWHVRSMEPGTCHLCGMKLVDTKTIKGYKVPKLKKGQKLYTCPMKKHWHVVSYLPGKCHLCGMKLVDSKTIKGYRNPYTRNSGKKTASKAKTRHSHQIRAGANRP